MKILLVEDDVATVETVRLCTEIYYPGSEIVSISHGLKAIERLETERFDVVLVDLGLPDIDGFDVLKEIRKLSNIPMFVVSARHDLEAKARAKLLGASGFVTKP